MEIDFDYRLNLLKNDIRDWYKGIIVALVLCIVLDRIFGTCCPMRIVTGLPCPACGTTRSLIELARGNVKNALWYQPFLPFVLMFFVEMFRKRYILAKKIEFPAKYAIIIVISVFAYMYRMYVYFPDIPPLEYMPDNLINILIGGGC